MRYIVLFIWSLILAQLLTYVVSSMTNVTFNYQEGIILGIGLAVVLSLIGTFATSGDNTQEN